MKVAIVLCAIVSAVLASPFATSTDDFRDEFDRLLIIRINEQLADIEHFLAGLTHQLVELEKNKSKALKEQILREVDAALNVMAGAKTHLEGEMKRTDLNFLEKFNLDEVIATIDVLTKELTEVQKHVKALDTNEACEVSANEDYREEFDKLLIAMTMENFHKLEASVIRLSNQFTELEKSKNKELKLQILREISLELDFVESAKKHLTRELERLDMNLLERFNFEDALSVGRVLKKDLNELATKVKAIETN